MLSTGLLVGVCSGLSLVLFYLMAVVSDEYLVPALEALCEVYKIPKDVAGATMLAAGASLPELVSNVVSIYVTKTDVGVGTIVGSEIFNHAAILCSVCASAKEPQQLNKLTCVRDIIGYTGALLLLLVAVSQVKKIADDDSIPGRGIVEIKPFTTLPVVAWYGFFAYLCTSSGRERLRAFCRFFKKKPSTVSRVSDAPMESNMTQPFLDYSDSDDDLTSTADTARTTLDDDDEEVPPGLHYHNHITRQPRETSDEEQGASNNNLITGDDSSIENFSKKKTQKGDAKDPNDDKKKSTCAWFLKCVTAPARAPLWLTLPEEPAERPHLCTVVSLLWLMAQSFAMVELLEAAAEALDITSAVVGLTVGAVGTSFPNLISAAAAAKTGSADMAVSASLGANVFNLSIALGLPWLFYPIVYPAHPIFHGMHDANLTVLVCGLLATVAAYTILLLATHCKLRKPYAIGFLLTYVGFIAAALFAQHQLHSIEDFEHGQQHHLL